MAELKIRKTLLRCPKCGHTKTWTRYSTQIRIRGYTLEWCGPCRWLRWYRIEEPDHVG